MQNLYLPGQGLLPRQSSFSVYGPLQLFPPYIGLGLLHIRDLILYPRPQVTGHGLQELQSDQPPSSVKVQR